MGAAPPALRPRPASRSIRLRRPTTRTSWSCSPVAAFPARRAAPPPIRSPTSSSTPTPAWTCPSSSPPPAACSTMSCCSDRNAGGTLQMRHTIARERGFTLIELAVVIGVVALLLGSILVPLGTQVTQRNISTTRTSLSAIEEAIMGYALTQGRLPCPDTTGDGLEDRTTASGTEGCTGGVYVG